MIFVAGRSLLVQFIGVGRVSPRIELRRAPQPDPRPPDRGEPQESPPDPDRRTPFSEPSYPGIEPPAPWPRDNEND